MSEEITKCVNLPHVYLLRLPTSTVEVITAVPRLTCLGVCDSIDYLSVEHLFSYPVVESQVFWDGVQQ